MLIFGLWDDAWQYLHLEDWLHPPSYMGMASYNLIFLGANIRVKAKALTKERSERKQRDKSSGLYFLGLYCINLQFFSHIITFTIVMSKLYLPNCFLVLYMEEISIGYQMKSTCDKWNKLLFLKPEKHKLFSNTWG